MPSIPKRVETRLIAGIKKFQPVLTMAKNKDVNESDTVVILNDLLADVFGYEKYVEITSEFAIRNTYCDLAITLEGKLAVLIEAKAIGIELKDVHVKQAIDYAANQGVDWVVLSNGIHWRIYKVIFAKPIDQELVCEFDFSILDPKDETHLQFLYLLTKEGWAKSAVGDFLQQKQALSRFHISAAILSESVLNAIKRELKRVSPDVRIENDQIEQVITQEVMKREILENEKYRLAEKAIGRAASKAARVRKGDEAGETTTKMAESPVIALIASPIVVIGAAAGLSPESIV
ncbi:MAG TPA: type I restriction enzyme HsdR N-terminal domain-containing protein [Lacunisphaera sp.]|jgi:predicted type IV restriction endonuclease